MQLFSNFGLQTIEKEKELKNNNQQNLDPETGEVRNVTGDILNIYKNTIQSGTIEEKYMSKAGQKICM